ncbi:MurR/RpiR family transcriptional regulator [Companilactobacillus hulinensis]|uniref:MurR/RpiR family transcriptional regulator n=1 Tax=Companilactobacillus hulinensis TaxID=2486007 RepID=UPI0013DDBB69|nr:MurR/RpiR family transcriptional regulator [Companilactobacillus hulinensis]
MNISKFKNSDKLSSNEKQVLQFLLDNNSTALDLGVRGVAKANYTSTSTVMRLAQKLGYSGFVEMHYRIAEYIMKDTPVKQPSTELNNIMVETTEKSLKEFAELISEQEEKFIYIYATGFSTTVAEYFYKKLLILGKKCLISTGGDSIGVFENNLNNIGLLIVVSKSGETKQVLDKVKMAQDENIEVIGITGNKDSSINYVANLPITCKDDYPLDDYNQFSNDFFPNILLLFEHVICLYERL